MSLWQFFFGAGNQLEYERNKAILAGPAEDIARIREFDREVGRLTASFNGVSRVPEAITQRINDLARKLEPSLGRVVAKKPYQENALERASGWIGRREEVTEVPLERLEYVITYPGSYKKPIEQRVAEFKVGK